MSELDKTFGVYVVAVGGGFIRQEIFADGFENVWRARWQLPQWNDGEREGSLDRVWLARSVQAARAQGEGAEAMSDQRPKWMPSLSEVDKAFDDGDETASGLAYRTGLRAQIAVLNEIVQFFHPDGLSIGEESWLLQKVAALRKELGG